MDAQKAQELSQLAKSQISLAQQYVESRQKAGDAKKDLDILLTDKIGEIRAKKSNVGIEMAYIMLMEISPIAKKIYEIMEHETARYKGLEFLIEAHKTSIMIGHSIMKYIGEGEKYT